MFLTDNQLEEFKKTETFKMLIKGTYLGVMENDFKNMTKKQLVDWCFKRESEIFDLKQQLSLTEKALELACERVKYFEELQDKEMGHFEFFGYDSNYDLQAIIEQYKEQAKEMMESE